MKKDKELEQKVLQLVNSDGYQPVKPRVIAKKLKLNDEGVRQLKRTIKYLVKLGHLVWGPKHILMRGTKKTDAPRIEKKKNELTGVFHRAAAGFGFVTPDGANAADRADDIYIPKQKTGDAADGDKVRIRFAKRRQGDEIRTSGKILEVTNRRTHRFVGTYSERSGDGFVTVDSNVFESGVLVGDAGAKRCNVGDKVVIEMANFPSPDEVGEGVIVEVLGDRGKPGVDTLTIIREYDLPEEFSENVLDDARKQAESFDESIAENRTDFTDKTVVTIDPKTARDFDDAISLEQIENGHWQLGVHIADVSHFVPERSDLDNEAYFRATSVYLPDRVIPMLPEIISNNLASLQPDRVRYTMTALIEFNAEGVPIATELHRGAIKSAHRFNYEEIDNYLENDNPWKKKLTPEVFKLVRDMHSLAMVLRERRLNRGAIELALPDIRIDLDNDGKVKGAYSEENTESHQVIEEFMLAANEAVAQRLTDEGLFLIRRIHDQPAETKLKELTKFIRQMGIECESLESRFEIKRVVELAKKLPEGKAIHFSVLRSFQKAIYSPREVGHYALAIENYCHFTSPIRRYPDLIIHRMIGDLIDGKKPKSDFERLTNQGVHCSTLEKRAEQAERELTKLKLLNYFSSRIGDKMEAVITGVESFGLFAQGLEIPVEGLIPVSKLPDDSYHFDRASRMLSGYHNDNQFRLGDQIQVRVAYVDTDQRQLEFQLIQVTSSNRRRPLDANGKPERKASDRNRRGGARESNDEWQPKVGGNKKGSKKQWRKNQKTKTALKFKSKSKPKKGKKPKPKSSDVKQKHKR